MGAHAFQDPHNVGALLAGYRPSAGSYDELRGPDGRVREHWLPVIEALSSMSVAERRQAQRYADDQLREHEAMFRVGDEPEGRPWRLDLVPLQMSAAEWSMLESGLAQRAALLDAVVADCLGAQRLLTEGVLPPIVQWRDGDYPVPCHGLPSRDGHHLHLVAFDLARDGDGVWRVLRDRVGTPTGLGYALENRIIISRCLPGAFEAGRTRRVAGFFRGYNEHLVDLAGRDDPLGLVLTPLSVRSSDYFEHAFLGRYLGYSVVQGPDLTVRDGRVLLKTVEGLTPVDLLLRRVPSADCDPLELRVDSVDGVAGLMQAARQGRIAISNLPGSEIGENPALGAFLPAISRHLRGEPLAIAGMDAWWCGAPGGLERALDELPSLRLQQLARTLGRAVSRQITTCELDDAGLARLRDQLAARPQDYVAQRLPVFSSAPTFDAQGQLRAAPVTIRLYLAVTPEGYRLMPGGLARTARADAPPPGGRLPNDANKDIWVPRDERVQGPQAASLLDRPLPLRRSDRNLASRTADDLFWLGVYLERAEGATRLFRALLNAFEGDTPVSVGASGTESLANLLVTLQHLSPRRARRLAGRGRWPIAQQFNDFVFDAESPDGLVPVLGHVARIAGGVRERLSPDLWRVIERLCKAPTEMARAPIMHTGFGESLNAMIDSLAAINGMMALNMTRADGWRFLDMGRRLERIRHLAKLVGELAVKPGEQEVGSLYLLLELADCTITYRSRYRSAPRFVNSLDLLISDTTNPRALIHQVQAVRDHVKALPIDRQNELISPLMTAVLRLEASLRLADLGQLEGKRSRAGTRVLLSRLMERTQQEAEAIMDLLGRVYFNHAIERRVAGQDPMVAT